MQKIHLYTILNNIQLFYIIIFIYYIEIFILTHL
jgi:hypothetical protein